MKKEELKDVSADTLAEYLLDVIKIDKKEYEISQTFLMGLADYLEVEALPSALTISRKKLLIFLGALFPHIDQSDIKLQMFIYLL